MTQIAKLKDRMELSKLLILNFSDITAEEREKLLFETACQWAENHSELLEDASYITMHPEFWGWWKLEWSKQEERFADAIHYFEMLDEYALVIEFGTGRKLVTEPEMIGGFYRSSLVRKMLTSLPQPTVMEACLVTFNKYNRI